MRALIRIGNIDRLYEFEKIEGFPDSYKMVVIVYTGYKIIFNNLDEYEVVINQFVENGFCDLRKYNVMNF